LSLIAILSIGYNRGNATAFFENSRIVQKIYLRPEYKRLKYKGL